jgi:hypothetical protein
VDDDPAPVPGPSLDHVSPEQSANDLNSSACAAVQKQHALEEIPVDPGDEKFAPPVRRTTIVDELGT